VAITLQMMEKTGPLNWFSRSIEKEDRANFGETFGRVGEENTTTDARGKNS